MSTITMDHGPLKSLRAESWAHLQELLFEDSWNPELGRFRSRRAFRGLSDADYVLSTALIRLGGDFVHLERHLLRNFRKYAARSQSAGDSIWQWLSLAQHHGLPTRLMDWTYSPYVALHFATANIDRFDRDGVIWAVDYVRIQELLPDTLRKGLEREGANVFTTQLLSEQVSHLDDLPGLWPEPFAIFFEPPSMDDRIANQFAFFSILSDPTLHLDAWLERHPELCTRLIIPKELKWEIRDKLDQANITERVLFPGLDGLSRWLKRHYSPRDFLSDQD